MEAIAAPQERAPFSLVSLRQMLEHYATRWFSIAQLMHAFQLPAIDETYREDERGDDTKALESLAKECRALGLTLSCKAIRRLEARLSDETFSRNDFGAGIKEIETRIKDELEDILFFYVPKERRHYYTNRLLFGSEAENAFPGASFDIEECGKCLALGRGTTCVFHLMRIMEILLKDLGKKLRIPYAPSWESYLSQIEKRISAKHRTKGIQWKRDEPYYTDLLGDLRAVKIAWRNPTMHVRRNYALEEAEDVFRAVRTFARRLSSRP